MTTFPRAQIKTEINRIVAKAKETPVLVTDVSALDDSGTNFYSMPVEVLREIVAGVSEKAPETSFMIMVAGDAKCQAIVYKAGESTEPNPSAWLEATGMKLSGEASDYAELPCENHSSLKKKDELSANAFAYLRKHKLLDEHEEDEMPAFDW
eukprot:Pompholyxophrys_sp_v1_NODE_3_length_18401_cov_4.332280.p11 type:complete len:152 gc:universal NODE_3_length_18401_cov_4.332280:15760-16215(+)